MSCPPKVSICIPTYNQPSTLKKCLESIRKQTFQDYELIISDDTPSDVVKNLIDEFDFGKRLKYYHNSPSLGSPENWNFCISKSSGELIKIQHHDDWFRYDYSLQEFVDALDANPESIMAFSDSHVLFENGTSYIHSTTPKRLIEIRQNPLNLFLNNDIGGPSATIFRKKVEHVFDTNLVWLVDVDFYMSVMFTYGQITYIPKPLVTTFEVQGRISDSCIGNSKIQIFEHFYLYNKINSNFKKLLDNNINAVVLIHIIKLCLYFKLNKVSTIREFGYKEQISPTIRLYFYTQRFYHSPRLANLFNKLLIISKRIYL